MEIRPYSLADNFLLVHFDGIGSRCWFAVTPAVAEQAVDALCFPADRDGEPADEPPLWIRVPLADGSLALLSVTTSR